MSTLNVSNITDGTTTVGTSYVVNGSAKAWGHVASDATLNDSFNISGGVDNGAGNYTLSFTAGFSSTRYPTPSTAQNGSDKSVTVTGPTTSSFTLECFNQSGTNFDSGIHTVSFGDLA